MIFKSLVGGLREFYKRRGKTLDLVEKMVTPSEKEELSEKKIDNVSTTIESEEMEHPKEEKMEKEIKWPSPPRQSKIRKKHWWLINKKL